MDIPEHRTWMYNRFLPGRVGYRQEFLNGLLEFFTYVQSTSQYKRDGAMRCPCKKCENRKYLPLDSVHEHLLRRGFVAQYWYWTSHGEQYPTSYQMPTNMGSCSAGTSTQTTNIQMPINIGSSSAGPFSEPMGNNFERMIFDQMMGQNLGDITRTEQGTHQLREESPNLAAQRFFDMLDTVHQPICSCSDAETELSMGVEMMSIKSEFNLSQTCFNRLISLIRRSHEPDNKVPENYYETSKLLGGLGLSSVKIDCCINGCMIYYKDDVSLTACKFCTHPRYKPRRAGNSNARPVPYGRMHYLPITPRLQRLYYSQKSAEQMRWHAECVREESVLLHPSDGMAWKHFDAQNPVFASDARNVRLGLCADGFSPFSHFGAAYSCWPVIVTPYNLPPELCMTTPYMFLSCIIPGPKNPKSRIDVYMRPLIDELQELWNIGVDTYDVSLKQNFRMRAALLWTINDFPAYGMLSGWTTAGRLACPVCMEQTKSFRLANGGKTSWFDCHRRFLPYDHPFRQNRRAFYKGRAESSDPVFRLSGDQIFDRVCDIHKIEDVPVNHSKVPEYGSQHNWVKRSIFWDLPYWRDNLVRHNLDVMHIEKNVFDNVIHTVMDVKQKTKDNEKSRMDLPSHCIRRALHLRELPNGRIGKPKACFTMSDSDRNDLFEWIENLRMPDGYASNLSRCVDRAGKRLHGMKSHDCHVFMQRLLSYAFLSALPAAVYKPLTELSQFFRDLCANELRLEDLHKLDAKIPVIICKLERIFPPAFFDVMEHLPVHLPYEAIMCGPVHYRWMYPFERFLHDLKGMVKNRARVEGSICEGYLVQEISHFSSYYFPSHVQSRSTRRRRNETYGAPEEPSHTLSLFKQLGRVGGKCSKRHLSEAEYRAACLHVLNQCDEVLPFIELYKQTLRQQYPDIEESVVQESFDEHFLWWFEKYVHDPINACHDPYIIDLACGPLREVYTWSRYFVNGYVFHTEQYGLNKTTYNSGVCVKGDSSSEFYGVLKEVVQLRYPGPGEKVVVLFNCDWFDSVSNRGIRVDREFGHIEVRVTGRYPKYDPFVLAQHVSQAYYIPYPGRRRDKMNWRFVIKTRPRSRVDQTHIVDHAFQEARSNVNDITDVEDHLQDLVGTDPVCEEVELDTLIEDDANEFVAADDVVEDVEDDDGEDEGDEEDEEDETEDSE